MTKYKGIKLSCCPNQECDLHGKKCNATEIDIWQCMNPNCSNTDIQNIETFTRCEMCGNNLVKKIENRYNLKMREITEYNCAADECMHNFDGEHDFFPYNHNGDIEYEPTGSNSGAEDRMCCGYVMWSSEIYLFSITCDEYHKKNSSKQFKIFRTFENCLSTPTLEKKGICQVVYPPNKENFRTPRPKIYVKLISFKKMKTGYQDTFERLSRRF